MWNSSRGSWLPEFVDGEPLFQFWDEGKSPSRNVPSINRRTERVLTWNTWVDVVNPDGSHVITLVEWDHNGADYGRFINHHTLSDIHEFRELEDEKMAARHYINKYFLPDWWYKNNWFQGLIEELAGIFGSITSSPWKEGINFDSLKKLLFTLMSIRSELSKLTSQFRLYSTQDIAQLNDLIKLIDSFLRPRVTW